MGSGAGARVVAYYIYKFMSTQISPDPAAISRLSRDELRRYSRHLLLDEVGREGQERLKSSRVLLIGVGGLGSPASLYLAAAGVGTLGIVDSDLVEESNLQRQIAHGTAGLGTPKTESAALRLHDVNPHVEVVQHRERLTSSNALDIARGYDVIVDGSDNFPTRYLVNDTSVLLGIPSVYGSIHRFEGQASVFGVSGGPCYRCLFREPPPPGMVPSCAEAGVLGVLPGLVGTIQATETLKLLLGKGDLLVGRLLLVDALAMRFREISVRPDPACPACGTREIRELVDYEVFCGGGEPVESASMDGRQSASPGQLSPEELSARFASGHDMVLLDVREPHEHEIARIEGSTLIPLRTLPARAGTLDRNREIVVYCHGGVRSMQAAQYLASEGYTRVWNLTGGIDRWSREVDPSVPRY